MKKGTSALIFVLAAFSCAAAFGVTEAPPLTEAAKLLPDQLGDFRAEAPAKPYPGFVFGVAKFEDYNPVSAAYRVYQLKTADRFIVRVVVTGSDSAAYALQTAYLNLSVKDESGMREELRAKPPLGIQTNAIGTASLVANTFNFGGVGFVRGSTYIHITGPDKETSDLKKMEVLARLLADPIDKGDGDIPVLIKHLPDWEKTYSHALYAVSVGSLKEVGGVQPVFDALNFDGGTEAVIANYGQSQLLIVEFTTPQFSVDNDQRILARIQELKSQGQAVPSAYRRVGNYSVFVFNAVDDKSANELIEQVKYEKTIQWLGEDPYLYERIQRYVAQTSAGVLVAVLKSSGLSLLICLGLGTLSGALLFRHRRAQQAALYSDAGGGVRLNLDELTGASNSHRLLGPGPRPESDSTQS